MNILLTGAAGQLGRELQPLLARFGPVFRVDRAFPEGTSGEMALDLGDLSAVEALLADVRPKLIVNAAAFTAVDAAEDDPDTAYRINGKLPECLARYASDNDAFLVHYSTDYVFDGSSDRPYREDDAPGPLNVYGASKLEGEQVVTRSGCRHVTLRTSWVYSGHGHNFVLTMLRLAETHTALRIVDDQVGRPTWARNLANASIALLEQALGQDGSPEACGVYHYCDREAVSWCEFARAIFDVAKETGLLDNTPAVEAIASEDYPQKAQRPRFSVLDTSRIESRFGIEPAGLRESLRDCIGEVDNGGR